jgi:hypothetical protein
MVKVGVEVDAKEKKADLEYYITPRAEGRVI